MKIDIVNTYKRTGYDMVSPDSPASVALIMAMVISKQISHSATKEVYI
jgi:hypothetical protein